MVSNKLILTVFTPTYNRAYCLNRCYESLCKQTCKNFLWLIVDDGSTDNTREIVENWKKNENSFEIQYIYTKNGGKQRAHNVGVENCSTEIFVCVDSDDYLTSDSVEALVEIWNDIAQNHLLCGIVALKSLDSKTPIGGTYMPNNAKISTLHDLYNRYHFVGDTILVYRTNILKQYPFFVAEDEKFMSESFVYEQIDQKYKLYLLNKILCICEYLPDGYSQNIINVIRNNPKGYTILKKQAVIYSKTIKEKIINTIAYLVGCLLSNEKNPINKAPYKIMALLVFPLAKILYYFKYKCN